MDGTSNTIGFAEHYGRCGHTDFTAAQFFNLYGVVRRATFADGGPILGGQSAGDVYPITVGNPPVTTGSVPGLMCQVAPRLQDCDPRLPQKPHPSGMLTAMMDGSVHIIAPSIVPETFWSLVTPAGGEVIGDVP